MVTAVLIASAVVLTVVIILVATGISTPVSSLVFFMTPCSMGGLNSLGENLMMLPLRLCLILH